MRLLFIGILYLFFVKVQAQEIREIKGKDHWTYTHNSGVKFLPEWHQFKRSSIKSFDPTNDNISVKYDGAIEENNKVAVTVFIYPNLTSNLNTTYAEFYSSLNAINDVTDEDIEIKPEVFTYTNDGYTLRGLAGLTAKQTEYVAVLECGKWIVKIRFTSLGLTIEQATDIRENFFTLINPSFLVRKYAWKPNSYQLIINKRILVDSDFSSYVLLGAYAHSEWFLNNVEDKEKMGGVPGLHLKGYVVAIKSVLIAWESNSYKKSIEYEFLSELKKISDSGFLNEFVMEQYHYSLFKAEDEVLDYEKYEAWKKENPPNINLERNLYTFIYRR